ncbi:putative quinol monooxygenase [Microbacterium sp. Kw_RZR3]|jgi:autoinducer 2-degrading protein|uniref:antibiotic biosynthesis monooxygenase n=1 Tax=unclassified Microbacterium TaxID=2609290 RepID=UPI0023DA9D9E|nr:putative quinol monooxygenase [Microbacterium sp. Kw_RZR3]MDF2046034.1 putative quinol monooxygenase [Microbacterium sp. Kw_RZR3]
MHAVWVELEVLPGKVEEFRRAIAANAEATVRDEPGCFSFDVIELDPERQRFAFYEIYRDREAFVVEHRSAAHYGAWKTAVAETVVPGSQTITEGRRLFAERA